MNAQSKKYIKKRLPGKSSGAGLTGSLLYRVIIAVSVLMVFSVTAAQAANPDPTGNLRIEIISAYNLVVDSNVTTPATYAPEAATLGAKVCNDGDKVMDEVQVYIGDYATKTPGTYPEYDSSVAGAPDHVSNGGAGTGTYSLTHESGSFANNEDASRAWVGTLQPGECRTEYWVVSYPRCVNVDADPGPGTDFVSQEPPCTTAITGGSTTADDIALSYDIWATGSYEGAALEAEDSRNLTLRSEISAAANKIWPNGDNKVPEEYKAAIAESFGWDTWTPTGSNPFPGQVFETQGIWYDLGNVNQGFDNNGDGVPDQNAWLQPVGIPDVYDPGCFRLVGTYGILIVKLSGGGEKLIPFKDQMYFENIPDNTGVVGLVFYEYAALNGKCTGTLTPYQEVASGFLNEKFSGDYGTAFQITTQEPLASIAKGVSPETAALGSTLTYQIEITNPNSYQDKDGNALTVSVGNPDYGAPLVIRDSIPAGVDYAAGSAKFAANASGVTQTGIILYSTDDGTTWSTTEPASPGTVTDIEWRMDAPLTSDDSAGANTMKVEFQAIVPGSYTEPFVSNTGCAAIGSGPCFDEDDAVTLIEGDKTISGTVFLDDSGTTGDGTAANGVMDGSEGGEGSVTVTLYYDVNGDGELDDGDIQWGESVTTSTVDGTTGDYSFTNLPDAKFIVVVDDNDGDLTGGAVPTTSIVLPADTTPVDVTDVTGVDFGFLPPLEVTKVAVDGAGPYGDGEDITYNLTVKNRLPASGTNVGGQCVYTLFPSFNESPANNSAWSDQDNVYSIDGESAVATISSQADPEIWGGFTAPVAAGSIVDVQMIVHSPQLRADSGAITSQTITAAIYKTDPPGAFTEEVTSVPLSVADIITGSTYAYTDLYGDRTTETWQWSEIADLRITLQTAKGGGADTLYLEVDAVTLQVTSSEPCASGSNDIITEVKLQDEYNNTQLSYQSSSPERDSWIDSGTTTTQVWDNLGPLAPGESKVVTVTMKGINGTTGTLNDIQNTARVADGDAKMGDGRIVNSGEATAEVYLVPAIDISGTLFSDKNSDGWDSTTGDNSAVDTYLPGQTVELWACVETDTGIIQTNMDGNECVTNSLSWAVVATSTTDADGNYIFEGVTEGYYYVKAPATTPYGGDITAAPSDASSTPTSGSGTADDQWWSNPSDSDSLNNVNVDGFLKVGGTGTYDDASNIDFGYGIDTGAVSGYIWEDVNGNGEQEDGENGLSGITVQLTDPNTGNVLLDSNGDPLEIITDANGFYEFTGLPDGQGYRINVLTQGETGATGTLATDTWTPTQETIDGADPNPGNDATIDGDINFTASGGQVLFDRNFGYQPPNDSRQIDGTIYYDLDGDGIQGANEPGVEGLTVSLYQDEDGDGVVDPGTDALYTNVTTNPDGSYSFPDLPSQNFIVVVDDTPIGTYQQIEDPDVAPGGGVCVGTQCDGDGKADVTGGNVTGLDFGYQPPQDENAISGLVWTDLDGDTVKNSSAEAGIGDVTVTLQWTPDNGTTWFDLDTQPASDGTTDVDGDGNIDPVGSYHFGDLPNGTYRVAVSETDANLPKGLGDAIYTPTTGTDEGTTRYFEQTLSGSTTSENNNFGFTPTGVIGDSIYWDVNGDGTQGTGEPGIAGVEVYLCTEPVASVPCDPSDPEYVGTTTTDADGKYLFYGLPDDNYTVAVGSIPGSPAQTADPDNNGLVCTDPLASTCDNSQDVAINGNSYMGADFGYEPPLFIGDQLFIDTNNSGGDMDATDVAIPYVTVTLTDCGTDGCGDAGDVVYITETDENGNYAFVEGLVDGNKYTVTVDTGDQDWPTEYGTLTPSYNGHDSGALDNSIELTLGSTPVDDADLGYQFTPVNDLSGTICLEGSTGNGYCGAGAVGETDPFDPASELPYEGTTVYVSKWTDADGDGIVDAGELVPITQTVTDAEGKYAFTGLPSVSGTNESYLVSLDAPADLLNLTTAVANTPATGLKEYTDLDGYTSSAWQSITPSTTNTEGLDFAFEQTVAFDFGDLPLPFETKLGIDGARHIVPETPNLYLGAGVSAEVDGQPSAGAIADDDDGVVQVGTWFEGAGGGTVSVTTYGAGHLVAWIDFNGDGSFNGTGEMIINEAIGTPGATVADQNISFTIPAGGLSSPGYARFRFFPKGAPALELPKYAFKGEAKNGEVEDYLFDLSPPSSIGDSILLDTDGDGAPDQGIEGAVVELQNEFCNPGVDCPTVVTDANGKYLFTGLGTGTYTVVVKSLPSNLPTGTQQIYDPDSTLDAQTVVNITAPGTEYLDADFWYGPNVPTTGNIGDRIWNDADGDGVQDMGESGLGGVTVALKYSDGSTVYEADGTTAVTAETGPDGSYLFTGVAPDSYKVVVDTTTLPTGATQTGDPDGTKDHSTSVSITAAGETVLTADFGYQFSSTPTSDIGDTIYHKDIGGIAGVTVVLKVYDTSISDYVVIAQDVTDSTGKYLFPGLPPGDYTVEVTDTNGQLDSYVLSVDPDSSDGLSESYNVTVASGGGATACSPLISCEDVDFGYDDPVPTYALVSSFNAYVNSENQVVLEWKTASEIGTIGFLLERLNKQSGKYQAITKKFLPGMLTPPHGGTYRYVDKSAKAGSSYTYRVVEVAVNDQGIISGPYTVTAEQPLLANNRMFADGPEGYTLTHQEFSEKQIKRFVARDEFSLKMVAEEKKKTGSTLKIPVSKDGLVYLTAAELATTSGFSENQVVQYLKAKKCLVTLAGESIPVITATTGSGLWFYGQAPERNDIPWNVYLLELGVKGVKMKNTPGRAEESIEEEQSFLAHVKLEENHTPLYLYNINKPLNDFWAWEYVFAYGADAELLHTVDTPYLTGEGIATVTVNLVGVTNRNSGQAPPYKVSVLLNGHDVGTAEWSEEGDYRFRGEVAAELLQEGTNEVRIVSHLNTGVAYSMVFLDSIEVEYQRSYEAVNGELFLANTDYDRVTVKGFKSANVLALDITDSNSVQRVKTLLDKNKAGEYTVTVLTEPGHKYFVTENIGTSVASDMTVDSPSQLRSANNRADYLIITSLDLMKSAQKLADHRAGEGMTVMLIDIEDVQDEFSHGLAAPEAVRDFLSYVYKNWAQVPGYVALIGDGSYDYKDYLGYGASRLPSMLVSTPDGFYPSDNALADVVGDDGVPEFSIGRIPVVDNAELNSYFDKIIDYEHALLKGNRVVTLVTDKSDPLAGDFMSSTNQVDALVSKYFQVNRLDADSLGYSGVKNGITSTLQQGTNILHYTGHSSWIGYGANSSLMSSSGIESMTDLTSPVLMVSMACSSASFGYPAMNSVGESAVLQPGGAAVGFFGATGLSRNYLADILSEGFYRSLSDSETYRFGDAVVQAKQHYFNVKQGEKRYTLDIYNLLGDPAAHIPVMYQ